MKKRIGIVGGGISGLVCAYELKRAGADVVVFEKNRAAGGRMTTVYNKDGLFADLGANFYRGDNKYIKKYCQELGVPYKPVPPFSRQMLYKGKRVRTEFFPWKQSILGQPGVLKNKGALIKLIMQAIVHGNTMYDLTQTNEKLSKEPIQTLAKKVSDDFDHYACAAPIEGLTFYGTDKMVHSFLVNGVRQSLIHNFTRRHYSGPMETIPKALSSVLQIRYETVTNIESSDGKVTVDTNAGSNEFDAVVIATPNTRDFFKNSSAHSHLIDNTEYSQTIAGGFEVSAEAIKDFSMVYVPHRESKIISIVLNEGRKQIVNGKAVLGFATHHAVTANEFSKKTKDEVGAIVRREISKILPEFAEILKDAPLFAFKHWTHAIPVYTPGQVSRTREFLKNHQGKDGIYLTGDLLATPFVEGSMTSGNKTARSIINDLDL